MTKPYTFPEFSLAVTRRRGWRIHANDPDAAQVVTALASAMSLTPASPKVKACPDKEWREIRVMVAHKWRGPFCEVHPSGPLFCRLPRPDNNDMLAICMSWIGLAVARAELSWGGLLIHGALAEVPARLGGGGILLAGPGNVGKTTASNRLPPPWRALSDDAALVLRHGSGYYKAHPWPTWSRFYDIQNNKPDDQPGPGGSWNVQRSLSLRAVFFLSQSETDRIAPLTTASAAACLLETVRHVSRPMTQRLPADQIRALHKKEFANAQALLNKIPAYTLHLSLTGAFWEKIEAVLASDGIATPARLKRTPGPRQNNGVSSGSSATENVLMVNYTGPSMNPTLRQPDLLEVLPYGALSIRRGDVVYFHPPGDGPPTVHRVVRVTESGIHTQGDNNAAEDPHVVKPEDTIGRVIAAWRNNKRRKIAGGRKGEWTGYSARLRCRMNGFLSPRLHRTYRRLATGGIVHGLLPAHLCPRVYEFKQRNLPSILKLMVSRHVVGRYDAIEKQWRVDRPWRLIVDETKLPVVPEPSIWD